MKRKANPMMNSPMDLRLPFEENMNGIATAINGTAMDAMLTLNPRSEMIHAVAVVPMLAPMMTDMACVNPRSPALTKLTTITVVAEEDCMSAVIDTPVSTPTKRFLVIAPRMERMRVPAICCSPSLIIFIPYRNRPNAPINVIKSRNE